MRSAHYTLFVHADSLIRKLTLVEEQERLPKTGKNQALYMEAYEGFIFTSALS